jgi:hypothetical protein
MASFSHASLTMCAGRGRRRRRQRNDKSRNLVVAMPGVSMFSKANYAQRVPRAPAEGWSKYLAALKPRSEAASDPAQVDEGVQTLSDTEDEPIDGVKHGG